MIIIGIDPDVDKNGVAEIDGEVMQVSAMKFAPLIYYLNDKKSVGDIIVLIEAGWLNQSNWHLYSRMTIQKAAQIGNATGRNHEVGRKIAEMCEYNKIPYKLIKPLKKVWKGRDGKITAEEFEKFTGLKGRTNQEMRDAGLIAFLYKHNLDIIK